MVATGQTFDIRQIDNVPLKEANPFKNHKEMTIKSDLHLYCLPVNCCSADDST